MEDPYKMGEEGLPNSKLELMQDVDNKGLENIKVKVLEGV
jgi:hypothetical protein